MGLLDFSDLIPSGGTGLAGTSFTEPEDVDALPLEIKNSAFQLGIKPLDLAKAIGYETAGTFEKNKKGPTTRWGQHQGLIQWGGPQREQYGIDVNGPSDEQMMGVTQYLKDAGVQPGMGLTDVYSAINAGEVGRPNASDRPGKTVSTHVAAMAGQEPAAAALLGGEQKGNGVLSFDDLIPQKAPEAPQGRSWEGFGENLASEASDLASRAFKAVDEDPLGTAKSLATGISEYILPGIQSPGEQEAAANTAGSLGFDETPGAGINFSKDKLAKNAYERPIETTLAGASLLPVGEGPAARVTSRAANAGRIASEGAEVAEAGARLGIDTPKYLSARPTIQGMAKTVGEVPIIGGPVAKTAEKTVEDLGNLQRGTALRYSTTGGPETAGAAVRKGTEDWIEGVSAESATRAYDKVDELIIDPDLALPLASTARTAETIAAERANARMKPSPAVNQIMEAATHPDGMNYRGIKTLRSDIGRQLDMGLIPPELSKQELARIYGSLTDDLRRIIRTAGGPEALSKWERADRHYKLISDRRENLNRLLKANSDEQLTERLQAIAGSTGRADIKQLTQARKAAGPVAWKELASAVIWKMGRDPTGNFVPSTFATAYGKLSPRGRAVLFRSTQDGNLAAILDDLFTVSKGVQRFEKFGNTSKTGRTTSLLDMSGRAASSLAAISGGFYALGLSMLAPLAGGHVFARLLSKPASAAVVRTWARAYTVAKASRTKQALHALQVASKPLAQAISKETGEPPQEIYQKLGGLL